MTDITRKSIGMLFDEYLTTLLKIDASPTQENIQRGKILYENLNKLLYESTNQEQVEQVELAVDKLRIVLLECWNAQEIVMKYQDLRYPDQINALTMIPFFRVYQAAIKAQKTNTTRNKLIREIDRIFGDKDITSLEKTYG